MDLDKEFTILIVDDEESDRRVVAEAVGQMGYHVRVAQNGEEALAILDGMEIDLVLMDLTMPEMNGFEITKKIRDFGKYLPIIAMTAHASEENKALAEEAGMNSFLSKPIDFKELHSVIQEYLKSAF